MHTYNGYKGVTFATMEKSYIPMIYDRKNLGCSNTRAAASYSYAVGGLYSMSIASPSIMMTDTVDTTIILAYLLADSRMNRSLQCQNYHKRDGSQTAQQDFSAAIKFTNTGCFKEFYMLARSTNQYHCQA